MATGIAVHDLGSRNGTYVGGARVKDALGTEGTTIAIGQTTLVCVAIDDEDDDELAEPLPGVAGSSTPMRRIAAQVRRLAQLDLARPRRRGDGRRQGARRACAAHRGAACCRAVRRHQRGGAPSGARRERALRARARCVHGRGDAQGRRVHRGRGRHAVPRRDRRAPHRRAAEAAARPGRLRGSTCRRSGLGAASERAGRRRDARCAPGQRRSRCVPARSLPSARGVRGRRATASRPPGRRSSDRAHAARPDGERDRKARADAGCDRAARRARLAGQRARAAERPLSRGRSGARRTLARCLRRSIVRSTRHAGRWWSSHGRPPRTASRSTEETSARRPGRRASREPPSGRRSAGSRGQARRRCGEETRRAGPAGLPGCALTRAPDLAKTAHGLACTPRARVADHLHRGLGRGLYLLEGERARAGRRVGCHGSGGLQSRGGRRRRERRRRPLGSHCSSSSRAGRGRRRGARCGGTCDPRSADLRQGRGPRRTHRVRGRGAGPRSPSSR